MVLAATVVDVFSTLVVTRGLTGRLRLTRLVYRRTWALWRRLGARIRNLPRREHLLSLYGPLSLVALLVVWLSVLALGWALLVFALGAGSYRGLDGLGDALYFSGATLVTLSYGDITPVSGAARLLAVLEGLSGLGTVALMVSYLPALYGAYSRREVRLLTLDDPSGDRLSPISVVTLHAPGGDLEALNRFFREWEVWTADVLESHGAYPMLGLFRSQNPGQSWITALGVVADAATLVCANVPGAEQREAYFMHRRGRRTIIEMSRRFHLEPGAGALVDRESALFARARMAEVGIPLRDEAEAWQRLVEIRSTYGQALEELIDFLVAPRGFWGLSSPVTSAGEGDDGPGESAELAVVAGGELRGLGSSQDGAPVSPP